MKLIQHDIVMQDGTTLKYHRPYRLENKTPTTIDIVVGSFYSLGEATGASIPGATSYYTVSSTDEIFVVSDSFFEYLLTTDRFAGGQIIQVNV